MVAGDDSALWWCGPDGTLYGFEFDASSFDQSQSFGPLSFEYRTLELLGVPEEIWGVLERVASSPLRCTPKHNDAMMILRAARPFRDTGGSDTTIGNGIVMSGAVFHACRGASAAANVEEFQTSFLDTMRVLGLKMTGGLQEEGCVSFLKGLWYPDRKSVV